MRIVASRNLAAPRENVFAFLAQARNHHKLAGRGIHLLELSESPERELRGRMLLRGPLGVRRLAVTRTESWREPSSIAGTARLGARTRVRVSWELHAPDRDTTHVVLRAEVRSLAPLDGLLLRAGGGAWVRRLFASTLELLANETEAHSRALPA